MPLLTYDIPKHNWNISKITMAINLCEIEKIIHLTITQKIIIYNVKENTKYVGMYEHNNIIAFAELECISIAWCVTWICKERNTKSKYVTTLYETILKEIVNKAKAKYLFSDTRQTKGSQNIWKRLIFQLHESYDIGTYNHITQKNYQYISEKESVYSWYKKVSLYIYQTEDIVFYLGKK